MSFFWFRSISLHCISLPYFVLCGVWTRPDPRSSATRNALRVEPDGAVVLALLMVRTGPRTWMVTLLGEIIIHRKHALPSFRSANLLQITFSSFLFLALPFLISWAFKAQNTSYELQDTRVLFGFHMNSFWFHSISFHFVSFRSFFPSYFLSFFDHVSPPWLKVPHMNSSTLLFWARSSKLSTTEHKYTSLETQCDS